MERYLVIELGPGQSTDAVIGVEPGAPLLIVRGDEETEGEVYTGETLTDVEADANLAIAGDMRPSTDPGMVGMVHEFLVGQTFVIRDYPKRIRVIGKYRTDSESQAYNLFLPIETAQKAFEKEGEFSFLVIVVDSKNNVNRVQGDIKSLLIWR